LRGEQEALRFNPETSVLRVNIYGLNARDKLSLAEWILSELSAGNLVPGFTDVWFCPTLANDLPELILDMLHRKLTGIFHATGRDKISKYDFARKVAETFRYETTRRTCRSIPPNSRAPWADRCRM
jgi:dTDP-4-dehydrorhamnose reductase